MFEFKNLKKLLFPQYWAEDEPEAAGPIKYHPEFGFEDRLNEHQLRGRSYQLSSNRLDVFEIFNN